MLKKLLISVIVTASLIPSMVSANSDVDQVNKQKTVSFIYDGYTAGSGTFVGDNLVLTANHVVSALEASVDEYTKPPVIVPYRGENDVLTTSEYEVVARDTVNDLALVKTNFRKSNSHATLSKVDNKDSKYTVYGNSTNDYFKKSLGTYSKSINMDVSKFPGITTKNIPVDLYTMSVKSGYSGSGVFNADGELSGVLVGYYWEKGEKTTTWSVIIDLARVTKLLDTYHAEKGVQSCK